MIFFFHKNSYKIFFYLFLLAFVAQIIFWLKTENIKPNYEIIPRAPTKQETQILSFGDKEFLFRALTFRLQNSGDVFANFAPLKNYNYDHLYQWMTRLDELNHKSNLIPSLASYYFSQTQRQQDCSYVVRYLEEHAMQDIDNKWWWIFQAINLAEEKLHDEKLALDLAYKIASNNSSGAPLWTKQMPAFIHAKQGNDCMAFGVIKKILDENNANIRQLKAEELDFMRYFIEQRLSKLKNKKFDPRQCK